MGGPGSGKYPRKKREYPPEVVKLACDAYLAGAGVREVDALLGPGYRAKTILMRFLPERRPPGRSDRAEETAPHWLGDDVGYDGAHLRVYRARGRPSLCEHCGRTDGVFHWANLTGAYLDVEDYARLCPTCHRRYDNERRANGETLVPDSMRRPRA